MAEKKAVRIAASGFELVKIDELVPYARNAKKHSKEQIKKIRASLREFGFVSPVLIDREKNVLAGHGRIEAAKAEGMNEVPCVFAEGLTEAQRRAYIIADNRLTELGEWDTKIFEIEMDELEGMMFDTQLLCLPEIGHDKLGFLTDDEIEQLISDEGKSKKESVVVKATFATMDEAKACAQLVRENSNAIKVTVG